MSPLSDLTFLQVLDLRGTPVNDVSPLSGLIALCHLNILGPDAIGVASDVALPRLSRLSLQGWPYRVGRGGVTV